MTDLAAWLLEQIAADKEAAQMADAEYEPYGFWGWERVLAECDAKRRIVDGMTQPDQPTMFGKGVNHAEYRILRLLALPYADRPGYDEAWRP